MMAEPNAISHGLTTTGGAFTGIFKSAAKPEAVEQPRASAAAQASFFMTSPSPQNSLPGFGPSDLLSKRAFAPLFAKLRNSRGTRHYGRKRQIQARSKSVFSRHFFGQFLYYLNMLHSCH